MPSPTIQEAADGLIRMAAPSKIGKATLKSTNSPVSANKSRVVNGTKFLPLNTITTKANPKAATGPKEPGKGKSMLPTGARSNTPSPLSAPNLDERSKTVSTDTEDGASEYVPDHTNDNSEIESPISASGASVASISTTPLNTSRRPRPEKTPAKPVNKSLKRVRGRSDAGSAAAAKAKRIRSTALSRQAPKATSATNTVSKEFTNFTATIFIVKLGDGADDAQFHVHETVLVKSPRFVREIEKAKLNKRTTKHNILQLDAYDTIAFEQMVAYLYTNDFKLKSSRTAILRVQEIHELFSLAGHFQLPELQRKAVKTFSGNKMLAKVTSATFFDWAEDMYYEELDKEKGPFVTYFRRVTPMLLQKLDKPTTDEILKVVRSGGGFCTELFKSCIEMQKLQIKPGMVGSVVKKEEDMSSEQLQNGSNTARSR
ncbi:hypothetical protein P7C71_g2776, partial [Lecanoromycetidae sp. Uapishka_2]